MGSEDKACSAYLELMFPPFFLPFSVSSVERLIKANKNSYYALVTKSDLCNRSLEPLVRGPKYIFNRNIFTGRAVTRVDTQLEDLLQFAHDLYHLHVITPWAFANSVSYNKDRTYITLKHLIGPQMRTIQHSPLCCFFSLNYINKCMIKSCTEALRQLFEAGWHSCIHVSLHTKSNVPLCSSGVN